MLKLPVCLSDHSFIMTWVGELAARWNMQNKVTPYENTAKIIDLLLHQYLKQGCHHQGKSVQGKF